jgi:hypothetical protein
LLLLLLDSYGSSVSCFPEDNISGIIDRLLSGEEYKFFGAWKSRRLATVVSSS